MPLHTRHKEKKQTNYAFAILLVGLMVLLFSLTMIKMKQNSHQPSHEKKEITQQDFIK